MYLLIHCHTPFPGLLVEIHQVGKHTAGKEIIFHIPDKPFYLTLRLWTADFTGLGDKTHVITKSSKRWIEQCLACLVSINNGLHIVGQYDVRYTTIVFMALRIQRSKLCKSQRLVNSTYLAREFPRIIANAGTL